MQLKENSVAERDYKWYRNPAEKKNPLAITPRHALSICYIPIDTILSMSIDMMYNIFYLLAYPTISIQGSVRQQIST